MERNEMIGFIKALAGNGTIELYYDTHIEVGDERLVGSVTAKYVYLQSDVYVTPTWENDEIIVHKISRIPLYQPMSGEVTSRVKVDKLSTKDLTSVCNGIISHFDATLDRIGELEKELANKTKSFEKFERVARKFNIK